MSDDQQIEIRGEIRPEIAGGVYSNLLVVSHTPHEFTLDFMVMGPGAAMVDDTGQQYLPAPVVARVKVPPTVMFAIASAIADNVDRYEQAFGAINAPLASPPLYPPDEE
jgi:hypothetical protein